MDNTVTAAESRDSRKISEPCWKRHKRGHVTWLWTVARHAETFKLLKKLDQTVKIDLKVNKIISRAQVERIFAAKVGQNGGSPAPLGQDRSGHLACSFSRTHGTRSLIRFTPVHAIRFLIELITQRPNLTRFLSKFIKVKWKIQSSPICLFPSSGWTCSLQNTETFKKK